MSALYQNRFQLLTPPEKLRGRYYTPPELVDRVLDHLRLEEGDLLLDPACGDGSFLRGAARALARRFPAEEPAALARRWAPRLVGFDVDPAAAAEARAGLRAAFREYLGTDLPEGTFPISTADVLAADDPQPPLPGFRVPGSGFPLSTRHSPLPTRLLVVGNPPYVEAKRLPRAVKEALRRRYPEAVSGAPDLFLYFLHLCLGWLREADRLAFVLPNKVLVNANARRLRERLLEAGRLRGLWFATQAGLFPEAAVYPIVLFAGGPRAEAGGSGKPSEPEGVQVFRCSGVQEETAEREGVQGFRGSGVQGEAAEREGVQGFRGSGVQEGLRSAAAGTSGPEHLNTRTPEHPKAPTSDSTTVDPRLYRRTEARAFFPPPETPALRAALEALLEQPGGRLAEALDIRWAISFHRAGLRERFVTPQRPDHPAARPFLGGGPFSGNGEVTRYRLRWAGWWIRYDEDELRAEANSLPDPALFEPPKIVLCQNGRTLRAAYDETGIALKDTFLCGSLRPRDHPLRRHPRALVAVLCSRAVHFFYSHVFFGGHVNGGYLHFLRSFLVDVPLGGWNNASAAETAALVQQRETSPPAAWEALETELEARVAHALQLAPAARQAIAAWAAADPNWQARERVRLPRPSGVSRLTG